MEGVGYMAGRVQAPPVGACVDRRHDQAAPATATGGSTEHHRQTDGPHRRAVLEKQPVGIRVIGATVLIIIELRSVPLQAEPYPIPSKR
jgi:hypothetical protein